MARAIYSKSKPANAPRPALAPRTNLPQPAEAEAPGHVAAKAPRNIPTKCPRSNPDNRVSKAPRSQVPTKAPRDIELHLALRAANGNGKPIPTKAPRNMELHLRLRAAARGCGKVPTKYHGMVKMPAPRRNPVRRVRKIQQVQEAEESEEESLRTFYELYDPMVHEMVIKLVHKSCINLEISPPNHNLGLLPVYNLIGYFLQPI